MERCRARAFGGATLASGTVRAAARLGGRARLPIDACAS
ncbi:conserved hypothetical protein [Burkholderia mallei PRL-20]|uniref:Uncharacterized protein n=3 Tax=pseudomallei group TaxID=111527 RepID=A2S6Q8_BURM9|nr:hypothetical protein BMASAVP1_A3472 [Burkholderia mallei SAVP1]ABN02949.1 hypothetical protein BMA10229_A1647 [Burkholderia mallei NCTC 10229]ABN90976.1 hypothetical protein BURPS1106A_3977 [Burkholderia pseudomallei 1106a]ABO05486.1 hypothetical protein BMA10247_3078 [Burkholderia mallei NCTC 10247]AFR17838.1 hypothetical protein BPC006_I4015 [Burkholderia pseudomallei BPC006]EDK54448.1 hypothetical protein BMAFMH_B0337 [Burkholderia mallei FMH]EDK59427.1 hypothetical protein BMAJHU_B0330